MNDFLKNWYLKNTIHEKKRVVKPISMKTSFSMDDIKQVEKYLNRKIQVREGRLTDREGTRLTSSLKADLKLIAKARNLK
jgi:hypothetical protein